jgi:hypothetical protein
MESVITNLVHEPGNWDDSDRLMKGLGALLVWKSVGNFSIDNVG